MYSVNGKEFSSFLAAIAAAKASNTVVLLDGNIKWSPAPTPKNTKVRHVIVNTDGSLVEFSGVRSHG